MQLLTADVMELLINFYEITNIKYDIIVRNNNIYLRFYTGAMFELKSLKNEAVNKEVLQKYYKVLQFSYELADKLINIINDTQI